MGGQRTSMEINRPDTPSSLPRASRLFPGAGRPAVSASSPVAPLRRCPDAGPSPYLRRHRDHVAAAAAALGVGGARMGRKRHVRSVSAQRGSPSAVSPGAAASRRGGARRPHAHAAGARAASIARDLIADADRPRFDAAIGSAMRLRNSVVAELLLVVLIYAVGVASRNYVAVDANTWAAGSARKRSVARRLVAHPGQRAYLPVPAPSLVFPRLHLDALSLAGVTHRASAHADASRPRRRAGLPRQHRLRVHSAAGRTWGPARGPDRRSHLL